MKVFISQKMHGLETKDIVINRDKIISSFCYQLDIDPEEIEVVNPIKRDLPDDATRLDYLGEAIKDLAKADTIIFSKDAAEARGCLVEEQAVRLYRNEYKWTVWLQSYKGEFRRKKYCKVKDW